MAKARGFDFDPQAWLSESSLRMAAASTRGLWIDLLCHMQCHAGTTPNYGVMEATIAQFCQLLSCTETDLERFVYDNEELHFCDLSRSVTLDSRQVLRIGCRRLVREEKARQQATIRQRRHRSNAKVTISNEACHANVVNSDPNTHIYGDRRSGDLSYPNPDLNSDLKKEQIDRRSKRRPELPWPPGFALTETMREYARAAHINPDKEFQAWRNYCLAHDKHYRDWEHAWRTRIDNAPKFGGTPSLFTTSNGRASPVTRQERTMAMARDLIAEAQANEAANKNGTQQSPQTDRNAGGSVAELATEPGDLGTIRKVS